MKRSKSIEGGVNLRDRGDELKIIGISRVLNDDFQKINLPILLLNRLDLSVSTELGTCFKVGLHVHLY